MNIVLLILGILGIGAILIAAYVFTVAARNYVSDEDAETDLVDEAEENRLYVVRSNSDRRQFSGEIRFPLELPTGEVVSFDRRSTPDRRATA